MPESVRKLRVYLNANQRIRKLRLEAHERLAKYLVTLVDEGVYKHITSDVSSVE